MMNPAVPTPTDTTLVLGQNTEKTLGEPTHKQALDYRQLNYPLVDYCYDTLASQQIEQHDYRHAGQSQGNVANNLYQYLLNIEVHIPLSFMFSFTVFEVADLVASLIMDVVFHTGIWSF